MSRHYPVLLVGALAFSLHAVSTNAEEPPGAAIEEPFPPAAEVAPDGLESPPETAAEASPDGIGLPLGDDDPGNGPPPIPGSEDARDEESEYGPAGG